MRCRVVLCVVCRETVPRVLACAALGCLALAVTIAKGGRLWRSRECKPVRILPCFDRTHRASASCVQARRQETIQSLHCTKAHLALQPPRAASKLRISTPSRPRSACSPVQQLWRLIFSITRIRSSPLRDLPSCALASLLGGTAAKSGVPGALPGWAVRPSQRTALAAGLTPARQLADRHLLAGARRAGEEARAARRQKQRTMVCAKCEKKLTSVSYAAPLYIPLARVSFSLYTYTPDRLSVAWAWCTLLQQQPPR